MIVKRIATRLVEVPLAKPIGTAIHAMRTVGCVIVEAQIDDGIVGQSYIFALNGDRLKSLDEMVKGLAHFAEGRDPHDTAAVFADIWRAINPMGHKGVTISAASAIDVALWDACGKAADLPLHKMWGACRDQVATYASSGLWLSDEIDELVKQAESFVEAGFVAMKVRVGSPNAATDVERVRALRKAIGPGIALHTDVNQGLDAKAAIRLGRMLEEFDIAWLEEPVAAYDLAGHRRVREALDVPIASGETEYTRFGIQAMIDAGAADVLMPDLQRIGGYSEFHRAAASASANNLPVSSHIFTEQSLCLAGSIENCISVEHMDWFGPLFNETPELHDGMLAIPDRPGTGFTFDQAALDHFSLS